MDTCDTLTHIVTTLATSVGWFSSFLFLCRVNTVYYTSRSARVLFVVLWLMTALGILVVPFTFKLSSAQPGGLCVVESIKRFGTIASLSLATFDSIIYISISYRIIKPLSRGNKWEVMKIFFTAKNATPVPRALLRTGQLYFLYVPPICIRFFHSHWCLAQCYLLEDLSLQ